ncbi:MAG: hypothetical protein ACTIJJ_02655 [Galactobacter sp.]|uniref:hypothetical protein n=1 Tax=Galactobacter sp. TaxID=2676125 RepID=UPI0025BD0916|nr:hypothetical protein [Galactobacter sp.]
MDSQTQTPDVALKELLHRAFDEQIPNYGGYNLVFASGGAGAGGSYVVGFRAQPLELVVAPVDPRSYEALEPATSVDLTNLSHLAQLRDAGYEVAMSTGRMFRIDVAPVPVLHLDDADGRHTVELEQIDDCAEFHDFMEAFMDTLDSIDAAGQEAEA